MNLFLLLFFYTSVFINFRNLLTGINAKINPTSTLVTRPTCSPVTQTTCMFTSASTNMFTSAPANMFISPSANMFTSDLANIFTSDLADMFTSELEKCKKMFWPTCSLVKLIGEYVGLVPGIL